MPKKRRTKQQKIIAKLRRELEKKKVEKVGKVDLPSKSKGKSRLKLKKEKKKVPITKAQLFAYEPKLIKKDLIKTLLLSIIFIIIIVVIKLSFRL